MAANKGTTILIKAKQTNHFSFMKEGGPKLDPESVVREIWRTPYNTGWTHVFEMSNSIVWYGMLWYAMLCYGMVWKVWYAMRFLCYAMRLLCYAILWFML